MTGWAPALHRDDAGRQAVLDAAAREDNAGARQEAAACGRMAMRARIAGGDPRHFDLDARYYQRWPERTRVPTGQQIDRVARTRRAGWSM